MPSRIIWCLTVDLYCNPLEEVIKYSNFHREVVLGVRAVQISIEFHFFDNRPNSNNVPGPDGNEQ